MITNVKELEKLLAGSSPAYRGVVAYQGPSMLDGSPIVCVINKLGKSRVHNSKTGDMVQSFIINERVHPVEALKSGEDASVCGDCVHRMQADGSRSCYVEVGKSVTSVYNALHRGRYLMPNQYDVGLLTPLMKGKLLRVGTYGDPAAVPFQYWGLMCAAVKGTTGYSHQWRKPMFAAFKSICMASVDSDIEQTIAAAMGWRTFRVMADGQAPGETEIMCPSESGVSCADCKLCAGIKTAAKSIAIPAHGIGKGAFNKRQAA